MAELFPNEGLDYLLNVVPKGALPPTTLYVGLFTGATASTTPGATAVLATETGVTEADYSGYARQSIGAGEWGAVGAKTIWGQSDARGCDGSQVSFPAATAAYEVQINGFFIASELTAGVALYYSNFIDGEGLPDPIVSLSIGDIARITPTFGLRG